MISRSGSICVTPTGSASVSRRSSSSLAASASCAASSSETLSISAITLWRGGGGGGGGRVGQQVHPALDGPLAVVGVEQFEGAQADQLVPRPAEHARRGLVD